MFVYRFRKAENLVHFLENNKAGVRQQIEARVFKINEDRLTVISHVRWPGAKYQRWTMIALNEGDELVTLVRASSQTEANKRLLIQLQESGYEVTDEIAA